jgi:hypothetical protein
MIARQARFLRKITGFDTHIILEAVPVYHPTPHHPNPSHHNAGACSQYELAPS